MDNYSKINGSMSKKLNCDSINIKKYNEEKCYSCGIMTKHEYLYCRNCGASFEKIYDEMDVFTNLNSNKFESIKKYLNIKETGKVSLIALGILFIVSTICKFTLGLYNNELSNIINPLHILLAMNFGSIDVYSSSMMGMTIQNINFGLIIISLVSVTSIILANVIVYKNSVNRSDELIRKSVGVAFSYSILLGIISLLSKVTLDYSYNIANLGYIVQLKFNFIGMIIRGFIISFISTYMCLYRKNLKPQNMYIEVLKKSINMALIGYFCVLIVITIVTISDKSYLYNIGIASFIDKVGEVVAISQIALYMFGFGNLIPFMVGEKEYSLLTVLNPSIGITTVLVLISMIFLITLVIFISSCKLEAKFGKDNGLKPIILLSGFYSIIIGAISIISTVSLGGSVDMFNINNSASMYMGFGFISSLLISFIYSFIVSLAGYKLNIFNDVVEESNE